MSATPKPLNDRQIKARADYLGKIRETRRKFFEDFPDGCRVEFRRGPSTVQDPTIRTGKATVISKKILYGGRETRVKYVLDDFHPEKAKECNIVTFLGDNPVRIDKET